VASVLDIPYPELAGRLRARLEARFGSQAGDVTEAKNEVTLRVERERLLDVAAFLRAEPELEFDVMAYATAVDWLLHKREPRFEVVYHLFSTSRRHRMRLKAGVPEGDCWSPSLWPVWKSCDFMEREAYDMFGIEFRGHPDLRRILMPDDWEGWPLRKDFPLGGVKSFYFKRETQPRAGEPKGLVPRIRVQKSDI